MKDIKETAEQLLANIQTDNIVSLEHCATRLRFLLKNTEQVDNQAIKNIDGILSVIHSGGQFQVVIGPDVAEVYNYLNQKLASTLDNPNEEEESSVPIQDKIFNYIASSFQPLLPVLAGAGIVKGLLALAVVIINKINPSFDINTSGTYQVFHAIGDSVFYFLPILLGFTTAKALKSNVYMGAMVGAAMIHPSVLYMTDKFNDLNLSFKFIGIPFVPINYTSSVLPIIVGIAILSPLERWLNRVIPKSFSIILISFIALSVMTSFMIVVFGPITYYLSTGIAYIVNLFLEHLPLLAGAFIGGTWFLLVATGLHWAIIPIVYIQYGQYGYSTLLGPFWVTNMVQAGIAIAVVMKSKDKILKDILKPGIGLAVLTGIIEPILYSVTLKYKRLIPIASISGAIGGMATAMLNVKGVPAGLGGILSWPAFASVNSNFVFILTIAIQIISLLLAMSITLTWKYEK